ncbi:DUF4012 domain-containing protein [Sphaerisporangium aureirubrum]|uniref:DUF4012 domain-containing protein n=1 Tax=Sphaerisporangium aureirubrum TaxID=1544736 RepID=A0ABW1NSR4_9ACTN
MPRSRRRRRTVRAGLLVLAVAVVAGAGWPVRLGLGARDHLEAARTSLVHLRAVISARDAGRASVALDDARRHAAEARRLTGGWDWALLTHLPVVGDGAATVRGLAAATAEATDVMTAVLRAGTPLTAAEPGSAAGTERMLADIRATSPVLDQAVIRLGRAHALLAATPARTGSGRLDQARATALAEVGRLRGLVGGAATAAALLPPMLGLDGTRRYFLGFQTNAEARGTGGLVGAFGILKAGRGKMSIERLSANNGLVGTDAPVADHGPEFRARYGLGAVRLLSVSNLSPHFPYAAATWTAMWERQTGRRLDGAVAIDPVALSYLLGLIGPVKLPGGEKVGAESVVELTERTAYERYPDPVARKRFLLGIAEAVRAALPKTFFDPARLLPVAKPMVEERRVQIWSRRSEEQRRLAATPLGGVLPRDPGPFAALVVNNSGGNKLDYYLDRSLDYELGPCRDGWRDSTVRVRLTNDVPGDRLPSYVTGGPSEQETGRAGHRLWVSLYAGVGARLKAVRMDGARAAVLRETERSHPVYSIVLEFRPRQSRTLEFDFAEPAAGAAPRVPVQPLARPQHTRVADDRAGCGR